jgi:hypothetical protein
MRMASIFKVVRNDCVPSELATPTEQELDNAAIDHGIPRQHLGMSVSFVLPKCKQTEEYKSFCDTYYDSSCVPVCTLPPASWESKEAFAAAFQQVMTDLIDLGYPSNVFMRRVFHDVRAHDNS